MRDQAKALVLCQGTLGRTAYAAAGLPLVALWLLFGDRPALTIGVALVACSLTIRRLRHAALPLWLALLLLVPFVNVVVFAVLALAPPRDRARVAAGEARGADDRAPGRVANWLPSSAWASAAAGVVVTALLGAVLMLLATEGLEHYGWGLFVGLPFCLGLLSVLIYANAEERSLSSSIGVGLLAAAFACLSLIAVAAEGAICIVMALPLCLPLAALGALTGYAIQRTRRGGGALPPAVCSVALVLPGLMGLEARQDPQPAVRPVTTTVVIDAPPEVVWRNVVAFAELPAPRETIFKAGIAYPIGARIEGRGVGAVRRCRFSTGDFVEPITVWDAPRRLAFSVRSQPPPMKELSPYGDIHPPHLDGFLRSRRGEFRLTRLAGGRTRLQGTTWYENRMWPQPYWRAWSDTLIHRIHLRVLRHVRALSERRAG